MTTPKTTPETTTKTSKRPDPVELPYLTDAKLKLVATEPYHYEIDAWFELRYGELALCRIRCWSERDEEPEWRLTWTGPDNYEVDKAPKFATPMEAATWFYDHHIKEC